MTIIHAEQRFIQAQQRRRNEKLKLAFARSIDLAELPDKPNKGDAA